MMDEMDAVTLEVLWNRLISISAEQTKALIRASFSTIVTEAEDLACGVFDRRGQLIALSVTGTAGHMNCMAIGMKHFLDRFPPESLRPGDTLITNDPWKVSGHKHDITVVTPAFFKGELAGYLANTCHAIDIGGTFLTAEAKEVYEEGLAIPMVKLIEGGRMNEALFDLIRGNVREPDLVIGDIMAQVSGNEVGCQKLCEFMEEYGLESLDALSRAVLTRSEGAMRAALRAIPDGTYLSQVTMDGFDSPLTISLALTIKGDQIIADYTGTSPQVGWGINCPWNYTYAYTTYPIKCALCPEVPGNEGIMRPITVVAPEGCLLNATFPAPVTARHLTGHFCPPLVYGALAQAVPDRVLAECSANAIAPFSGADDRGRRYVVGFFLNGGMGARPNMDGISAKACPSNVSNTSVEVIENISPVHISRKELIPDSGGAGKFRGGLGQVLSAKVRSKSPTLFSCMFERIVNPPRGYLGGMDGRPGAVRTDRREGVHPKKKFVLDPGEEITLKMAGGGGFFPPWERDPEAVLEDVLEGLVTVEAARCQYGVAVTPEGKIDREETRRMRG